MSKKDTRRTVPIGLLVEDMDLYPRASVDGTHVNHIADAIEAGNVLPPIIVDAKTLKIVDGFHRTRGYKGLFGNDYEVEVIARKYANDAELFLDAMRLNSGHGVNLTPYDRTRCALISKRLGIGEEDICAALNMTVEKLGEIWVTRTGTSRRTATCPNGEPIALKGAVADKLHGKVLTKAQEEAMPHVGGNKPSFYANQLIMFIETDMLDTDDEYLMDRLTVLRGKIDEVFG